MPSYSSVMLECPGNVISVPSTHRGVYIAVLIVHKWIEQAMTGPELITGWQVLTKLADTKTADNKSTMLHYLVGLLYYNKHLD